MSIFDASTTPMIVPLSGTNHTIECPAVTSPNAVNSGSATHEMKFVNIAKMFQPELSGLGVFGASETYRATDGISHPNALASPIMRAPNASTMTAANAQLMGFD